jgi:hypothetical protein
VSPHGAALIHAVRDTGLALGADRCWLYARDPATGRGIALARWLRDPATPDVPADLHDWAPEPDDLADTDPLFARALAGVPLDAVDDVRTAPVNRELEAALGHRAFVHVNLHRDGALVGVLQPGMTAAPRAWTAAERDGLLRRRAQLAALLPPPPGARSVRLTGRP